MKKITYIVALLISWCFLGTVQAQEHFMPKTDGTKYYLQIYDGAGNEKVLSFHPEVASWSDQIGFSDYFDGSGAQLWVFDEMEQNPGYINVRNLDEGLSDKHFLKSWSNLAYLEPQDADHGREGNEQHDKELAFRFTNIFDDWYAFETIDKPADLSGMNYSPGPNALNFDASGIAAFRLKTADITQENALNCVFRLVEFDPIALFEASIEKGMELYDAHPEFPEEVLADLFYVMEKAREIRVFGTDGEMLNFQANVDEAISTFNNYIGLSEDVENAKAFIDSSAADEGVKESFNALIDNLEEYLASGDPDYAAIDSLRNNIAVAEDLVDAIIQAEEYAASLVDLDDSRYNSGVLLSVESAKEVLADPTSDANDYNNAIAVMEKVQLLIAEVLTANDWIANTQEFEDAKQELSNAIEEALVLINIEGVTEQQLDEGIAAMQDTIVAFQKALEAGDTSVELINPGFENEFEKWNSTSDTDWLPYTENKGVDGSKNMTIWQGSDYTFITYQSISNLPNGTYEVSVMSVVSNDNTIALFARSGDTEEAQPLPFEEWTNTKRSLQIEVTDGTLEFGIKGAGANNGIPANNWGTFDNFEVKWLSSIGLVNPGFENEFEGWTSTSDTDWLPYTENKGVDGSKNMTIWQGSDYTFINGQTLQNLPNGKYQVSVMSVVSNDSTIYLYADGGELIEEPLAFEEWTNTKRKLIVSVTNGSLTFGIKGAGTENTIPANNWGTFDNFEVVRLPEVDLINPGFEEEFLGWDHESDTDWLPYTENKGVDGSKNMTIWQGSDYTFICGQTVSGLLDGSYQVSVMSVVSNDSTIFLYADGGELVEEPLAFEEWSNTKRNLTAPVSGGSLTFGIKGAGTENTIPANNWGTFDNFELKLQSIIPDYEIVIPNTVQNVVTDVDIQEFENEVNYWQSGQKLNIHSSDYIVKYNVYSITGAQVEQGETRSTTLSIPMKHGIYVVKVLTENGYVDTEKVSIR
ncbi:tetratricopeptide repeat protein [uncultured Draconibacterium sp.]|uniref:tetratricopeptide repeat protein n=1 Tax=uncultured Draconibacterium sp. TaxID=1573823 RepID=UPI002AA75012|nr:tetratricopeptide repeat protein [uncultured Draconibacterium sp.]